MNKVEILGVVTACVFALLGFSESGFVAAAGTCLFAISAVCLCIAQEESKNLLPAKKLLYEKEQKRKLFPRTAALPFPYNSQSGSIKNCDGKCRHNFFVL